MYFALSINIYITQKTHWIYRTMIFEIETGRILIALFL